MYTALAAALLASTPALACSMPGIDEFILSDSVLDGDAPLAPVVEELLITRGRGPQRSGPFGGSSMSSCDDLGFLSLVLSQPADDRHDAEELGYYVEHVAGTLPDGMYVPGEPLRGPELPLHWGDGATNDQEPLDFTLRVRAVDEAGNIGDPVEVDVTDEGGAGCSTTGSAASGWLAVLALLGLRRR